MRKIEMLQITMNEDIHINPSIMLLVPVGYQKDRAT